MTNREGSFERITGETHVRVAVQVDGKGRDEISTGVGFLDHMLRLFAHHGLFDLEIAARGDLEVDAHHTVEDVAICLGQALDRALGDRAGIVRTAHSYAPMDEALARVVVDLSGRPYAMIDVSWPSPVIGGIEADLFRHFLETLATNGRFNLHAQVLYGRSGHHVVEALFKALARALDGATVRDPRRAGIPSTKGVLT